MNSFSIAFGFFNLNFAVILVQLSMFSSSFQRKGKNLLRFFENESEDSFNGGHKWTRTTDLTLIRRAL